MRVVNRTWLLETGRRTGAVGTNDVHLVPTNGRGDEDRDEILHLFFSTVVNLYFDPMFK